MAKVKESDLIQIEAGQWAELMGKYDAIIQAIQNRTGEDSPNNSALTQAVQDLANINVVLDLGETRTDIFGGFEEYE